MMKIIGNVLIYIGLFIIYQVSLGSHAEFTFAGFLTSLAFSTPLLAAGMWMLNQHEHAQQLEADIKAKKLANDPVPKEEFFLYLRPFDSTNAYKITDTHLSFFSWEVWERDGYDDIERLISRALSPTALLIALGKPGEHRGAGRLNASDANWKKKAGKLANRAKLIIVIPSHHEGTLWELRLILENEYLYKTIFIMPPSDSVFYSASKNNVANEWARTNMACATLGLILPRLIETGLLFKIDQETKRIATLRLPTPNPVEWMKTIQTLIDAVPGEAVQEAIPTLYDVS